MMMTISRYRTLLKPEIQTQVDDQALFEAWLSQEYLTARPLTEEQTEKLRQAWHIWSGVWEEQNAEYGPIGPWR